MQETSVNAAKNPSVPRTELRAYRAPVHFHSSDYRFCGSQISGRQFTMNEAQVTCSTCRGIVPNCDLCEQPMMLQQALDDADNLAQTETGSPYPQWACFCNSGHYIAA